MYRVVRTEIHRSDLSKKFQKFKMYCKYKYIYVFKLMKVKFCFPFLILKVEVEAMKESIGINFDIDKIYSRYFVRYIYII